MPKNVYSEINLHMIWHTKNDEPVLQASIGRRVHHWIGKLKGGSSFHLNHEIANRKVLDWQTGYGVVSFATKDLPWIIEYVKNQREHHARGTTNKRLEACHDDDVDDK